MPPSPSEEGSGEPILNRREIMVTLAGLLIVLLTLLLGRVNATVVLVTSINNSLPFRNVEANFAPRVPGVGIVGVLYAANPSNACKSLQNKNPNQNAFSSFLLVQRGECNFVEKVQNAQDAGYNAVIVYDNEEGHDLVTMSGSASDIWIYAVFVSKRAGEILLQYAGDMNTRCYLLPAFENTAWSVMAVSFISLLAVSAVLSTFFFVRRHRLRHVGSRPLPQEPAGMPLVEVKALPIIIFNGSRNSAAETCSICLEEYVNGEKLRVLPCQHEFHVTCIDQWLMTRRPFCPICKRDARCKSINPPDTECTPLMNSVTRHLVSNMTSTFTSIPAATQTSPLLSSNQVSSSFSSSPHTGSVHQTSSYPILCNSCGQDQTSYSSGHFSTPTAIPALSVVRCTNRRSPSSSLGLCNTCSSVQSSAPVSGSNNSGYPMSGNGNDVC